MLCCAVLLCSNTKPILYPFDLTIAVIIIATELMQASFIIYKQRYNIDESIVETRNLCNSQQRVPFIVRWIALERKIRTLYQTIEGARETEHC